MLMQCLVKQQLLQLFKKIIKILYNIMNLLIILKKYILKILKFINNVMENNLNYYEPKKIRRKSI